MELASIGVKVLLSKWDAQHVKLVWMVKWNDNGKGLVPVKPAAVMLAQPTLDHQPDFEIAAS